MLMLAFYPEVDGFAFPAMWIFDPIAPVQMNQLLLSMGGFLWATWSGQAV